MKLLFAFFWLGMLLVSQAKGETQGASPDALATFQASDSLILDTVAAMDSLTIKLEGPLVTNVPEWSAKLGERRVYTITIGRGRKADAPRFLQLATRARELKGHKCSLNIATTEYRCNGTNLIFLLSGAQVTLEAPERSSAPIPN